MDINMPLKHADKTLLSLQNKCENNLQIHFRLQNHQYLESSEVLTKPIIADKLLWRWL